MKNYAILRDAVEEKVFGIVIEQDGDFRFYGADDRAKEWANWANSTSLKSLQEALPVGVIANDKRLLVNDTELFIESLIESASNSGEAKKPTFSYKSSHVTRANSSTPSARDFQLRSFDVGARQNAINFKVYAFKNDQKSSSLMAKIRSAGLGFNEKTGEFRSNDITISHSSLQHNLEATYTKSLQRNTGFNVMSAKNIYSKSLAPFYTHPKVIELKRLGGAIGPKLGRGLRSAPMGMVFVDVTGAIDADKDGIVFEGKPGLERPIIPKFILPEGVGRRVASLISGAAEQNEKNRRSGAGGGGVIDEAKLRSILGTDASSLNNLNAPSPLNDGDNADAAGMRSIAGNIRSRRDAIIAKRTASANLSRVGTGEKTQLNTGDSRAVEKMTWDDSAKELIVTFAGGRTYTYNNVDDSWVDELEKNPDALGRIMNDIKKAGYDFTSGGTHAPDKTLASRMQGRREAAGMRSRVSSGEEIGTYDSDRYKGRNESLWAPKTDREKEIEKLTDYRPTRTLEDGLADEVANHMAKTRDAIYDGVLTGEFKETEANEALEWMMTSLRPSFGIIFENDNEERQFIRRAIDKFEREFTDDAEKRFARAAEIYEGVREIRRVAAASRDNYDDPYDFGYLGTDRNGKLKTYSDYIDSFDEYLEDTGVDKTSAGDLKKSAEKFWDEQLEHLFNTGERRLGANHAEEYDKFANALREQIQELNREEYPLDLVAAFDELIKRDKDWHVRQLENKIRENKIERDIATLRGIGMSSQRLGMSSSRGLSDRERGIEARAKITQLQKGDVLPQYWDDDTRELGDSTAFSIEEIRQDSYTGRYTITLKNLRNGTIQELEFEEDDTFPNVSRPLARRLDMLPGEAPLDTRPERSNLGMRSAKKPSDNDFDTNKFLPSLADRENYIASDEYEADLEDWLTRFPRKTEADFRRSKTFMENVSMFNPSPDVSEFSREKDIYDGWSPEEIDSGLPDILWRGMGSRTSNLTPEGKRDINDATKKLSDFSRSSSFGDVYPGAEKFDSNNEMHQFIYDQFEDADMPSQRVQDVLNAVQALKEVFGEDSDVGMDDRMQYALDHIAPTFDSRLALSRGVRRRNGSVAPNSGMGSRTSGAVRPAGFTQRSRTAMLERTAIGSPTGMRSARKSGLYAGHDKLAGQQRVSPNDGQLWASLSPADKQLFAERARARESELIQMMFDKFEIPIAGTDRRLDSQTLSAKERAKILKETGGGISWVEPDGFGNGYYLLNEQGYDNISLGGEFSVKAKAKKLAKEARQHLANGEMEKHKEKVTQLASLLRLADDLRTLAGARLQGEADESLLDKNDAYDLAIDHLHPVSKARIMDVNVTDKSTGKNSRFKTNAFSQSGSNRPFEFNFSKAQMAAPSTAINVPGRPLSEKDDILRSAGVAGDDIKIKGKGRVGGFLEFMRDKLGDQSKKDQKAEERRIKKLRASGVNVGSVAVGGKPTLLDKRAMKISRIARKKLLNAKARKIDALNKSAADNNDSTPVIGTVESGQGVVTTMLTPGGITALAKDLKVGEKEWKKAYRNEGRNKSGHSLAFVWEAAGMNGTPNPINEEEFKELLAAGWKPIKRGTGTRGYALSYFDLPKRHLPEQAEAYGPGEYWSTGPNNSWTGSQYYPEPDGQLGDGPGGIAGLLPPTAKIMTAAELDTIREQHRAFSSPILGNFSGYTEGELGKTPQQDFVDQLVSDVFGKIPRDSAVWNSAIGQMTLQLISALESNPSPQEYEKLRNALFRLTTLVNQDKNVYGPIFGADALDMGNDVILVMNRAVVSVFADPLPVGEIISLSQGRGISSGYVAPGSK